MTNVLENTVQRKSVSMKVYLHKFLSVQKLLMLNYLLEDVLPRRIYFRKVFLRNNSYCRITFLEADPQNAAKYKMEHFAARLECL